MSLVKKISGRNVWTLHLINQPIKKSPKLLYQRKCYYKTLETSVVNSALTPLSLSDSYGDLPKHIYDFYSVSMFDQLGEFFLREATKLEKPLLAQDQIQDKLEQEDNCPMDDVEEWIEEKLRV